MRARLSQECRVTISSALCRFRLGRSVPLREFQRHLGFMASRNWCCDKDIDPASCPVLDVPCFLQHRLDNRIYLLLTCIEHSLLPHVAVDCAGLFLYMCLYQLLPRVAVDTVQICVHFHVLIMLLCLLCSVQCSCWILYMQIQYTWAKDAHWSIRAYQLWAS